MLPKPRERFSQVRTTMNKVVYTVYDQGVERPLTDTERAERLSRAGFRVTAEVRV